MSAPCPVVVAMDTSFADGFNLAKQRAIDYLTERADWLRREYLNGGNFEYLRAKEEDCRYTAKVISEMAPPEEFVKNALAR